jgi:hypothetical protein
MGKDYFRWRNCNMQLSQCDVDMIVYAFNHIDWSEYNDKNFGGEGIDACGIHLDDIEQQLEWCGFEIEEY